MMSAEAKMKRWAIVATLVLVVLVSARTWTEIQRSQMKHPVSGEEITVPGRDGTGILLPDGWRVTPAGRQLESGDMILSAAISPDGQTLAFTNSGYTRHQFHLVDLASEKEVATFPLERAWSGLAWSPNGRRVLISAGQGNAAADLYTFQRWDDGKWTQRPGVQIAGVDKTKSAVSSVAVSPDGRHVYAIDDPLGNLYILDGTNGKTISKLALGDHPFTAK